MISGAIEMMIPKEKLMNFVKIGLAQQEARTAITDHFEQILNQYTAPEGYNAPIVVLVPVTEGVNKNIIAMVVAHKVESGQVKHTQILEKKNLFDMLLNLEKPATTQKLINPALK
jgi:hypothetical protein